MALCVRHYAECITRYIQLVLAKQCKESLMRMKIRKALGFSKITFLVKDGERILSLLSDLSVLKH